MVLLSFGCAEPPDADTGVLGPTFSGTVRASDGTPTPADLMVCAEVCLLAATDEAGRFEVGTTSPGRWSVHAQSADGALAAPVEIDRDLELDLWLAPLEAAVPVPAEPALVEVAPGLRVELSTEALPGIEAVRAGWLAAELWPPLLGVEGAPAGGWVLWPLGVGRDLRFEAEGQAWCTDELGLAWVRCRVLPDLGAILR